MIGAIVTFVAAWVSFIALGLVWPKAWPGDRFGLYFFGGAGFFAALLAAAIVATAPPAP